MILTSSYELNWFAQILEIDPWYEAIRAAPPGGVEHRFTVFGIPRHERDSMPLHAVLFGHELGHIRTVLVSLLRDVDVAPPAAVLARATNDAARDALLNVAINLARSWLSEFAADAFGALCYGPAALFALSEVAGPPSQHLQDHGSHPSRARRLAIALRILDERGFGDVAGLTDAFAGYRSEADLDHPVANELWSIVWTLVIRPQLDELIQRCQQALAPDELLDPIDWPRVRSASTELGRGRTIGERLGEDGSSHPEDLNIILNAAWLRKLEGADDLLQGTGLDPQSVSGLVRSNTILDQLVLKSFEIAGILEDRR